MSSKLDTIISFLRLGLSPSGALFHLDGLNLDGLPLFVSGAGRPGLEVGSLVFMLVY